MRIGASFAALIGVAALAAQASAGREPPVLHWTPASLQGVALPVRFTVSPPSLRAQCRRTARAVDYPVPCPLMTPGGLEPTPTPGGSPCVHYRFHIVGVSCGWDGWVAGSSQLGVEGAGFQHLVIVASPTPTNYGRAVNGPVSLPPAYEHPIVGGAITVHGWNLRWLFVDPARNPGSAFMNHVVLCWTVNGHTYAVGFHAVTSKLVAAAMDYDLIRHLQLVRP